MALTASGEADRGGARTLPLTSQCASAGLRGEEDCEAERMEGGIYFLHQSPAFMRLASVSFL